MKKQQVELSRPPEMKDYYHLQPDGRYYEVRGFFLFGKFITYLCWYDHRWKAIWFPGTFNSHALILIRKQGPSFRRLIFLWWLFISLLVINIVLRLELL